MGIELKVPLDGETFLPSAVPMIRRRRSRVYEKFVKRRLDFVLVVLSLPVVLPLVLLIALIVALDGASPFYRQLRVGRGGRVFSMWKIRTMVPRAEELLEEYLSENADARREWAATQKLKKDPRITWFGAFLRKSSLDELPQLWNVLKGDMSLVGPRPMMVEQKPLYPGSAYYSLRPGITGYWQVSERNAVSFAGRAEFDNRYYTDLSFRTDLKIFVKTLSVVLRGTGY
ncbi:sugar transferase [Frigidibacter sp. ROC022]|uniref:sugar transferase n=1 Tax=Frigidibacter sp. ROC022 TaxID=2971796 RepID=UPI00215ABC1E|nr:sugar transferase [Frigidibacter sp. ROC022]MCR8726789.1 sugar transferase [Frigidibacter sp. ROC022]